MLSRGKIIYSQAFYCLKTTTTIVLLSNDGVGVARGTAFKEIRRELKPKPAISFEKTWGGATLERLTGHTQKTHHTHRSTPTKKKLPLRTSSALSGMHKHNSYLHDIQGIHRKKKLTPIGYTEGMHRKTTIPKGNESFYGSPPQLFFKRDRRFWNQLPAVSPAIRCPLTPRRHRSI